MNKIESIVVAVLLTASLIPLLDTVHALDQSYPVYGVITDSDGDAVPTGVAVTVTDVTKSTDIVVYTEANEGSTGYYQVDLSSLENCEDGDTIEVSCTHNGETNAKSFTLDVTGTTSKSLSFSLVGTPDVDTDPATGVGSSSATLKGTLNDLSDIDTGECQVWFQWGTTTAYGQTTSKNWKDNTGSFSTGISGLQPDTTYHYRAVAENSKKRSYGSDRQFKTSATDPSVSTREADSVGYQGATLNGYLSQPGASSCDVWFVYDTTSHLNWQDYEHSTTKTSKNSPATFSTTISGLAINTTYHYRAVAENSADRSDVGDDKTFTTHIVAPSVTTTGVDQDNVTSTTATLQGDLSDLGGAGSCTIWFEYGTTAAYGSATPPVSRDATGSFEVTITGLQPGTAYRFRAVAENSQGTSYGTGLNFVTAVEKASIETGSVAYAVVLRANVTNLGGEQSCDVWFEYGPETGNFTNTTPVQEINHTGLVTQVLTGLQSNLTYHYRAVINNSQGVTYGSNLSFQMMSLPAAPTVTATDALASGSNVTFHGNLTSLGDSSFCYVWFEYQREQRHATAIQQVNTTGPFNATATDLPRGTYSYRVIAVGDTGRIAYSQPGNFTIGDASNEPPSVTLISPSHSATVPLDTSLRASVTDQDGDTVAVTFHLNGEEIPAGTVHSGTASIAPILEHGTLYTWYVTVSDGQDTNISLERNFTTIPVVTVNFTHPFLFNGETAWFTDTSSGNITSREWTFDQQDTMVGANVTYIFATPGIHTVSLEVTDDYGSTFSHTRQVTVWRRGDANMDSRINALDITAIQLAVEHGGSYPAPADVDGNGAVTDQDVTLLINKILGLT